MNETRILIRLLRIYFPRISGFGPASEFRRYWSDCGKWWGDMYFGRNFYSRPVKHETKLWPLDSDARFLFSSNSFRLTGGNKSSAVRIASWNYVRTNLFILLAICYDCLLRIRSVVWSPHTHTHTNTHARTHAHIHRCTCIHTHTHTHAHSYTRTLIHAPVHRRSHTDTHTRTAVAPNTNLRTFSCNAGCIVWFTLPKARHNFPFCSTCFPSPPTEWWQLAKLETFPLFS
jgi:hypothetical protein